MGATQTKQRLPILEASLDAAERVVVEHVLRLLEKALAHPEESKYRRLKTSSALYKERFADRVGGVQVLFALGFEEDGERMILSDQMFTTVRNASDLVLAAMQKRLKEIDDDKMQIDTNDEDESHDDDLLAKALAMSTEIDQEDTNEDEALLAQALAMSEDADPHKEEDKETLFKKAFERGLASGLSANEAAAKAIEETSAALVKKKREGVKHTSPKITQEIPEKFQRKENMEQVAEEQLAAINLMYNEDGIEFVDPSFAPTASSLYQNPADEKVWKCAGCGAKNSIPPDINTRENVLRMIQEQRRGTLRDIACKICRRPQVLLEVAMRPAGWARPRDLRDDLTLQKNDVPWQVFRGEPRADDARQGAVGNCWFVCALSVLADRAPDLLKTNLITKQFNPAGAYQVRLNVGGLWHVVTIDDTLPITALETVAYVKPARRSLWAPLIEKAAAKLHGSYEALSGGSFAEAFSMLTGFPVGRVMLDTYRRELREFDLAFMGANGSPERKEAARKKHRDQFDESFNASSQDAELELFAQLYSLQDSGFAVGASTSVLADHEAALETKMRSLGLQTRHAYGLLDVRQYEDEYLVKLRNPNGVALWRGPWSSQDSGRWNSKAMRALGLDKEDAGVFWMPVADFAKYFVELTVCRLLPERVESRTSGWLASAFGPGEAVAIETYARSEVDFGLYQEPHARRGAEAEASALDLGLAVLKLPEYTLIASTKRQAHRAGACASTTLELDAYSSSYLVVPLCFGHVRSQEPRKFVAAIHSTTPLILNTVPCDASLQARALIALALRHGQKNTILSLPNGGPDLLNFYALQDEAGTCIVAENKSPYPCLAELHCGDSTIGFVCTRGEALSTQDVVPSNSRLVLAVFSRAEVAREFRLEMGYGAQVLQSLPEVRSIPSLDHLGDLKPLHQPIIIAEHERHPASFLTGGAGFPPSSSSGGGASLSPADLEAALRGAMGGSGSSSS